MKENITPVYVIEEKYQSYPQELRLGDTLEEAKRVAAERLIVQASKAGVVRRLDPTEVEELRTQYTTLTETTKIEAEERLESAVAKEAEAKEGVKSARESLSAVCNQIDDRVKAIKRGVKEEELSPADSFSLVVDGHYLHYTWTGECFSLAKAAPVPADAQGDMFIQQTRNQEAFIEMFGCDFSPSDRFERVEVGKKSAAKLAGRRLAARAVRNWTEDFADEGTGEVVSVDRHKIVFERDRLLSEGDVSLLLQEKVTEVVLYKAREDAPAE